MGVLFPYMIKILGKDVIHTSKFACGDVLELGYTGNGAGEFTRITDLTSGDITPLSSFDFSMAGGRNRCALYPF